MSVDILHSGNAHGARRREPLSSFLTTSSSKDNVREGLTKHFLRANRDLFDKYWQTLKEQGLLDFFRSKFGRTIEKKDRPFTFVVYGASGYTGKLILEYIYTASRDSRRQLPSRSPATLSKLQKRMDEITVKFPDATYRPEIFRADISNPMDIRTIVLKSKCVLSVAGPFMTWLSSTSLWACIDFDCDYVDVNGEFLSRTSSSASTTTPRCAT